MFYHYVINKKQLSQKQVYFVSSWLPFDKVFDQFHLVMHNAAHAFDMHFGSKTENIIYVWSKQIVISE